MYLDPSLAPRCLAGDLDAITKYRVKQPHQAATCIMAQYRFAHFLPRDLIRTKGLFGTIVRHDGCLRFLACPEISSLHGAVLPLVCLRDRKTSVRVLGNSISTPHAAVTLLLGARELGLDLGVSICEVVKTCLLHRHHAANTCLIPVQDGWLLCQHSQVSACLAVQPVKNPDVDMLDFGERVEVTSPVQSYRVLVSLDLQCQQVLAAPGFPDDVICHACLLGPDGCTVSVPFAPALPHTSHECRHVESLGVVVVVSAEHFCAVLSRDSAVLLVTLAGLAAKVTELEQCPAFLARPSGCRVPHVSCLSRLVLLLPEVMVEERPLTSLAIVGRSCRTPKPMMT